MNSMQLEIHVEKVKNGYLGMIFKLRGKGVTNAEGTAVTGSDAEEFVENFSRELWDVLVKNS